MRRLRGLVDLSFDLVEETTNLVERTHDAVLERSIRRFIRSESLETTAKVVSGIQTGISTSVFGSIRLLGGIARWTVNTATDVAEIAFDRVSRSGDAETPTPIRGTVAGTANLYADYLQASLNGFWGDHLGRRKSRLDLGLTIRHHGQEVPVRREAMTVAFPSPTKKICVFVHGLAATETIWSISSQEHYGDPDTTFGTRLRADKGFTPIYLRYNSGRHISENGRALATLLTEVLAAYPVPIEEITLVGHSMGGLVARSAAHYASENNESWLSCLRHIVCLGSPHLGAPLEKAVNLLAGALGCVQAAGAQVPAELLDSRSAGVKDLRHGYTLDEEWVGMDPDEMFTDNRKDVPLVDGAGYYFLAATVWSDPDHPFAQLLGDLMVLLPSASGRALDPNRRIPFAKGFVFPGMNHLHLANHPDVYEALRDLVGTQTGHAEDARLARGAAPLTS